MREGRLSWAQQAAGILLFALLLLFTLTAFIVLNTTRPIEFTGLAAVLILFGFVCCYVGSLIPWLLLRFGRRPRWWKGLLQPALSILTTFTLLILVAWLVGSPQGLTIGNLVYGTFALGSALSLPGALLARWIQSWPSDDDRHPADMFT